MGMQATTTRPQRRGLRSGRNRSERQRALLDKPWKVKLLQGAILAVVLVGAATGPLALLLGGHGAGAATTATTLPPSPVAATGFAELFVAAWLNQADQKHPETLTAFDPYLDSGDLAGMTPGQLYAARTVAIDATQQGKNYWAVTVGAEVLQMVKGSLRPAGTRYYAVGIGVARGRYIAMSLPEQSPRRPRPTRPTSG